MIYLAILIFVVWLAKKKLKLILPSPMGWAGVGFPLQWHANPRG